MTLRSRRDSMNQNVAIIEIGSNNTQTHIYEDQKLVYENNVTIEFKKNYKVENKMKEEDLKKLYNVIEKTLKYTSNIHIYGCSIFRNIKQEELEEINRNLLEKYHVKVEVVSQEQEAEYTTLGCLNIQYEGDLCIFIGGGGSIELLFAHKGSIVAKKYYDFGVVDITHHFPSLKEDKPTCTFDEVYTYINDLIGDIDRKADVLILAGGDHLYWYNCAEYSLEENTIDLSGKV